MEIEITEAPELKADERSLLDMHSVLNVLNVLRGELTLIGLTLAGDLELLRVSLKACDEVTAALKDPNRALDFAQHVGEREAAIRADITAHTARHPDKAADPELAESMANLNGVFQVLHRRALEVVMRAGSPSRWSEMSIADLQADFLEVFAAIEKNSRGRYRIIYNLALQQPSDYYIDFAVESANGQSVTLPILFKDVMRDLIANARKYTRPGGTINVGLYETETELRFVVQDTGLGIPADEITSVVRYGQRGSNVTHIRTMGGGFGLTKAVIVSKQLGGRFWIRSDLNVGTRITIVIPRSVNAAA